MQKSQNSNNIKILEHGIDLEVSTKLLRSGNSKYGLRMRIELDMVDSKSIEGFFIMIDNKKSTIMMDITIEEIETILNWMKQEEKLVLEGKYSEVKN